MEKAQLITLIEEFREKLKEHQTLWGSSLERTIPSFPIKNHDELKKQSEWLTRRLGLLRKDIERYEPNWTMYHQATGTSWDGLETAVGLTAVAQAKGPAISSCIERLNTILGELDNELIVGIDNEPSFDNLKKIAHTYLHKPCLELFYDGHFEQAKAEGAKAVLEYLREKTGSKLDGTALAEQVFSHTKPLLKFGDLSTETSKNLQLGMMGLVKGLTQNIRNPSAHKYGNVESKIAAYEVIIFCSMLCKKIDEAELVK